MIQLPEKIKNMIDGEQYSVDDIGMSAATVIMLSDKVLKIQDEGDESEAEYRMMTWLQDKLPVPKVLAFEKMNGKSYLLMSRAKGVMSCDESVLQEPDRLTELLAQGLKMLWSVDISDCPCRFDIDKKLDMARYNGEHDLVDVDKMEPETFGEGGCESPRHLLQWLEENRPAEEPVLVHGDFCLPNIFVKEKKVSGFIDLSKCGIADKWQDIALGYRSLIHNYDGSYGTVVNVEMNPEILFEKLGMKPDWEKIRYYLLMDELF